MKKITILLVALISSSLFSQTVTTFNGGTPDDAIALDSNGNIYCSNYMGDTVFKFTPTGEVSSFITGLNTPNGLAFNSNGELYVCDGQANTIYKYDSNGAQLDSFPVAGHPSGIIKSFTGESMIFTTYNSNFIYELATDGTITEVSSDSQLNGPVGLAYDENGTLYVGNYTDREIYKVLPTGEVEYIATLPTDGGPLPNLGFIAYAQGMLWGTTMGSDKIYAVDPNEIDSVFLFAGSTQGTMDGDISVATFNTPNGILFDPSGTTMYITDFGPKNLRIISNVVLSIEELAEKKTEIVLAPNPAKDIVNIDLRGLYGSNYIIIVYDILGNIIQKFDKDSSGQNTIAIPIHSWKSGTYFIEVISEGFSKTKTLIKE